MERYLNETEAEQGPVLFWQVCIYLPFHTSLILITFCCRHSSRSIQGSSTLQWMFCQFQLHLFHVKGYSHLQRGLPHLIGIDYQLTLWKNYKYSSFQLNRGRGWISHGDWTGKMRLKNWNWMQRCKTNTQRMLRHMCNISRSSCNFRYFLYYYLLIILSMKFRNDT